MTLDDAIYRTLLYGPATYAGLQVRLQEIRDDEYVDYYRPPLANPGQIRRAVKRLEQQQLVTHGWRGREKLWFVTPR